MSLTRDDFAQQLTNETIFGEWFSPMERALDKVRFSEKIYAALPMHLFLMSGCIRQMSRYNTLRGIIQAFFHMDDFAGVSSIKRSTMSDALSSVGRHRILSESVGHLIAHASKVLPDKLADIEGIGNRPIIATDATYQHESTHYYPVTPSQGGGDNSKGHQLLTHFDLRLGIPLAMIAETQSVAEIRLLKQVREDGQYNWMESKNAIHSVDRAFVDAPYWDGLKKKIGSTVITRMRDDLNYHSTNSRSVEEKPCNEGVLSDVEIQLNSSPEPWRLIGFMSPESKRYYYLTNDFTLQPGVVAFIYYRRWDIEKYFDNLKHDMDNNKAWGKSKTTIAQQALLAIASYILTRLFVVARQQEMGMVEENSTQTLKHKNKQNNYHRSDGGVAYRAFYTGLSKIPKQIWRFFACCFSKKASPMFYQRQLLPLMLRYL